MSRHLRVVVFGDEEHLLAAARAARARSFDVVEAYTPYPVHGLDEVLGIPRSRLPWVTLAAGATGLSLGTWLQYWASATDWPIDVGGKPFDSLPAFVPVMFELTILFAGLATFVFVLARSGLLPGRRPPRQIAGTTDDRFALVVGRHPGSPVWSELDAICRRHDAVAMHTEDEP